MTHEICSRCSGSLDDLLSGHGCIFSSTVLLLSTCCVLGKDAEPRVATCIVLSTAQTCFTACAHKSWCADTISVHVMTHATIETLWTVLVTVRAPLLTWTVYRRQAHIRTSNTYHTSDAFCCLVICVIVFPAYMTSLNRRRPLHLAKLCKCKTYGMEGGDVGG